MKMKNEKELDDIFDANCSKIIYGLRQNEDEFYNSLDAIPEDRKNWRLDQDTEVPDSFDYEDAQESI